MSFCVRSFTSGTKYVPSFVASAQGCVVRQFNSRQLAKHVNPQATSPFLNEVFIKLYVYYIVYILFNSSKPMKHPFNTFFQIHSKIKFFSYIIKLTHTLKISFFLLSLTWIKHCHQPRRLYNKATSFEIFLQFLGSSVPVAHLDINDDCKVSNETGEITNNAHQRLNSYCDLNQLDNEHYFNNEEPIKKISTHNERYDPFSHEVICVPFLNSAKERLVFSDNLVPFEDQVQIIHSENSCGNLSNVTNFKVLEALSKDESKVFFAAKNASAIKEKTVESTSSSKQSTDSEKKPSSDDLEQAFNTLSLDVSFIKKLFNFLY